MFLYVLLNIFSSIKEFDCSSLTFLESNRYFVQPKCLHCPSSPHVFSPLLFTTDLYVSNQIVPTVCLCSSFGVKVVYVCILGIQAFELQIVHMHVQYRNNCEGDHYDAMAIYTHGF